MTLKKSFFTAALLAAALFLTTSYTVLPVSAANPADAGSAVQSAAADTDSRDSDASAEDTASSDDAAASSDDADVSDDAASDGAAPAEDGIDGILTDAEGTIPAGVTIEGIDVSGMTASEAAAALQSSLTKYFGASITLSTADRSITASSSDLGVRIANTDVCDNAVLFGKRGTPAERFTASKDLSTGRGRDFTVSPTVDPSVLTQYITYHEKELVIPARDNGLRHENGTFVFVPGTPGTGLVVDKSTEAVASYIDSDWQGGDCSIDLVTEETEPKGDEEQLKSVQDRLGTCTTKYGPNAGDRGVNVERAAELLNGQILYPGDKLSVHDTISPITIANGYRAAGSYVNGQVVDSEGGGVCQVATTTYDAVLNAELAIETRASHSMTVHYVDLSFDAAIASSPDGAPLKDLAFSNNQEYPVYIEALTDGTNITVNIYGKETRDPSRTVTYQEETLEETPVEFDYTLDGSKPVGTVTRTSAGQTGYKTRLWKIVSVNGQEESRKVQNNSTYQMRKGGYTIGTAGADAESLAAINAAIAAKNPDQVKAACAAAAAKAAAPAAPADPPADAAGQNASGQEAAPAAGGDAAGAAQ